MSASQPSAAKDKTVVEKQLAQQRVYISGFQDTHNLVVGVAYYYRGHYLYAYPQRNPVEPVSSSTRKKGIRIQGLADDQAPVYDLKDSSLVCESSVGALERSCFHKRETQTEEIEKRKSEALAHKTFTPHDRGQYLAYSAPGSRVGSSDSLHQLSLVAQPNTSLGVPGQGRSAGGAIRATASTSRLYQLRAEEELDSLHKELVCSAKQEEEGLALELPPPEDYMDLDSISAFIEAVSRSPPRAPSRPLSSHNINGTIQISGDHHPQTRLRDNVPPPTVPALNSSSPSPTLYFPLSTRGRPRAASRALNEAYNAAKASSSVTPLPNTPAATVSPRCSLHDESCDGESVTEPPATLCVQMNMDFSLQQVPLIHCADGRVMVDWVTLRDQEVERTKE